MLGFYFARSSVSSLYSIPSVVACATDVCKLVDLVKGYNVGWF